MAAKEFNEPDSPVWFRTGYMHRQRYEFASRFVKGKRVLNVGCGPGYAEEILLKYEPEKIVSIDYDKNLIKVLNDKNRNAKVFYKELNAEQLQNIEEKFDLIISFENIEHLPDPVKFLQALQYVIHPEAVLLISTPNALHYSRKPGGEYKNPFHIQEWIFSEFVALLTPYTKSLQTMGQVVNVQEHAFEVIENSLRSIDSFWLIRLEKYIRRLMKYPVPEFHYLPLLTDIKAIDATTADEANTFLFVASL